MYRDFSLYGVGYGVYIRGFCTFLIFLLVFCRCVFLFLFINLGRVRGVYVNDFIIWKGRGWGEGLLFIDVKLRFREGKWSLRFGS